MINGNTSDVTNKKSKEFHALLIQEKAQLPNIAYILQSDFNFTSDQLRQIESYVKAFKYKVLNSILYTNSKLYKWILMIYVLSAKLSLNH